MRFVAGLVVGVLWAVAAVPASADQGVYPKTPEERKAAYAALHWEEAAGSYKLSTSHAIIQMQSGEGLLLGADAQRYSWLASGIEFPQTEAVLSAPDGKSLVYYEWRDEGYVSDSDWKDVDGNELLKQYRDSTDASNEERGKNGFEPMHVVGWLEPPHYDQTTHTVTYAMELNDKDSHWANAVALRLGRAGYTELTWVGSIDGFKTAGGRPDLLNEALGSHAFEEGFRYGDYQKGDKVAAYGIAGLVATALGITYGKGIMAALLALAVVGKKVGLILVAVIAYIAMRFRQLFAWWRPRRRS
ncbi:MAG TPA: DUF2167 domain-containing protein [Dongiaceae bacterium]